MTMQKETQIQQVTTMLDMQNAMNSKVHSDWFDKNFEWYRAIWIECGEMLDHYGWKWWKHQQPELEQVKLELVDIFHFGLSCRINGRDSFEALASQLVDEMSNPSTGENFPVTLESLAAYALTDKAFDAQSFAGCMQQIDMPFEELFCSYVGKNTLNFFRQDHGYKDGSYIKVWNGKEDNEHLVEVLNSLDASSTTFRDDVYQGLKSRYPE